MMGIPSTFSRFALSVIYFTLLSSDVYSQTTPFINEIHYDNVGTDTGEFVELAHKGSIAGYSIVRYNGNGGGTYTSTSTSTTTPTADSNGFFYTVITGTLQNGGNDGTTNDPDGIALVGPNNVVLEFLSYEGVFKATNGPAKNLQSTSIGVFERSDTPVGSSLQRLKGTNTWVGPIPNTKSKANPGPPTSAPVPVPVTAPAPVVAPLPAPVVAPAPVGPAVTKIHAIQGTGAPITTPYFVRASAIVTSLFTSADTLSGFWMQEEDIDVDANPNTSEGIFVFCGTTRCPVGLKVGSLVNVAGNAGQSASTTQIDATVTNGSVTVVSTNNPLPAPTSLTLPAAASTATLSTFLNVEGMLVTFPTTLVVSEYFNLARYGEIVLTESSVPFTFTQKNLPSVTGLAAANAELAKRVITLDDDNNDQNDAITGATDEPYYYPSGGLSISNKFRGGDTITGLTGVMEYSTNTWRVRPSQAYNYTFVKTNVAPVAPANVGGTLRVAAFNVLNYFTTLNTGGTGCGPTGSLQCRGANSASELTRQRSKIVAAITKMNPDIAGLIELQNSATNAAISNLVSALNSAQGPGTYSFIPTGIIGTDAIEVGLIYKPSVVTPVNNFAILNSSVNPLFVDTANRPVLTQTFQQISTGKKLTVSVCHLKSKGSACSGDPDKNDGQGNCPNTRKNAATALVSYLASDPTSSGDTDHLIVGDFNAYAREDPIVVLEQAGFTNLEAAKVGPNAYSYVFDGQRGTLDYAFVSASLLPQVTGVSVWNINADEVPLFDYNDEILNSGESSFERESVAKSIYAPDEIRSSDHDPVLIGFTLV